MKIPLSKIKPSAFQTRSSMDGQPMADLKASMAEVGLAVPIKVRPIGKDYELVYGHRRVEAAQQLGWEEIEAIVEELTDEQAMIQGLAENVQRNDLTNEEEGRAYKRLRDEFEWSGSRISQEVGKPKSWVNRCIALVEDESAKPLIDHHDGQGDAANKAEIIRGAIDDPAAREKFAKKVVNEGLTREQTRKVADAVKVAPTEESKKRLIEEEYSPFIHDADRIKEQVARTPGRDPVTQARSKKKDEDWKETPDVKVMLDRLQTIEKEWAPAFIRLIQLGKLDKAGYPFVSGKVTRAIDALNGVKEELL